MIGSKKQNEIWMALDQMLEADRFLRLSLQSNRKFDNSNKRVWQATLYGEKGQLFANAYGDTRDEVIIAVVEAMQAKHKSLKG